MRVCVVGSGGREHAYVVAMSATADVVITPGNPGIAESTDRPVHDIDADLYVIGPEAPLVDGLADDLRARGKLVFGPGADGARLEGSKAWMKEVVAAAGVPTASFATFAAADVDAAVAHLRAAVPPYVIKTDGLAAGKGVLVTDDFEEAVDDVRAKLSGSSFGTAGTRIVIEEGLSGPEASLFALCDGREVVAVPTLAQDHKRAGDGDTGPNTGGMGCSSPLSGIDRADIDELVDVAVRPTVDELRRRGIDYRGVLFAGFMLTADGPRLLEYNVRFGDPEAQVILPRLEGDVTELFAQVASGRLREEPKVSSDAMVTVVCASEGYPTAPRTGDVIEGLDAAEARAGVTVYRAGVGRDGAGRLVTAGGRVLNVCGRASDLATAREIAYGGVGEISWPGMHYRTDIAASAS